MRYREASVVARCAVCRAIEAGLSLNSTSELTQTTLLYYRKKLEQASAA